MQEEIRMNAYEKFLRLVEFSDEEMSVQLPLWENACKMLDLTESDMLFAADEWLPTYWDMSLQGVRKCIGAYIRELIELTRLSEYQRNGAKIIYYNMPSHPACIYANKYAGDVHISYPDYVVSTVFHAFFHKDLTESDKDTPRGSPLCYQCGMNKVKINRRLRNIIVKPTVLWNWGLYCDEAYKIEELVDSIEERDWNCVFTTCPQDSALDIPENEDHDRVQHLAWEIEDSQKKISDFTKIPVSEEHLIKATEAYLAYLLKVEHLIDMVALSDPQPITGNDLTIFQVPSQIAFDTGLDYLNDAIDIMLEEVHKRITKGEGILPKHSPRLACHFVPFSVPWINKAFIDSGINLSINTFFALASKQIAYFDREKIYESIARQWLSNPSAVNLESEAALVCEILEKYPQDGVLYGFFDFGCWIGSLKKTLIKIVENRTGIPHYYFESEFWNDERFSLNDRITYIKSIAYSLKINRMVNGWNDGKKKDTEG